MVVQHPAILHWLSVLLAAVQLMQSLPPAPDTSLAVHPSSGQHPKLQACLHACN